MAGLLDYLQKGLAGIGEFGMQLGNAQVTADPAMLEMMTPEQRKAAQDRANLEARAGMISAAAKGAPWWALTTARDTAAQPGYDQYVASAAQSVEELRKRRDADGRRQRVAELVGRLSNPEDPLAREYTPEQIAVLGAMTSDEQAALLAKTAFPKETGLNVATAGTVQGGRFKLGNGNIGAMVQTGDPNNPVAVIDTGQPYVSEDPSSIRELAILSGRPDLLAIAEELEKRKKTGSETGAANVAVLKELPALLATNQRHIETLTDLRDRLSKLDSGALTGRVLDQFSSEFQTAQALMYEEALMQIGALKAAGASLNPITEKELEVLFSTSPRLTNQPKANVEIINKRIQRIQRVMQDLREQLTAAQAGDVTQYNPAAPGVAPPPAAAPAPGAAPAAGTKSTIPVLPQHRNR